MFQDIIKQQVMKRPTRMIQ